MEHEVIIDDPGIPNETKLWRRIRKEDIKEIETGEKAPKSSPCFDDSKNSPMSVTITELSGYSAEEYLARWPEEGLVELTVGQIRALGLGIEHQGNDKDPGHALIHGKKTKSIKKKLARECRVIYPK